MRGGDLSASGPQPSAPARERSCLDGLRWPLWQLGVALALYSVASFPYSLAQGQSVWGPARSAFQFGGGPAGIALWLGEGPIGSYLFFFLLGTVLVAVGALVGICGGLLCWRRVGWGRGLLALGLALATLGQLAGVPQALSQGRVFHQGAAQEVFTALMSALWLLFLLALVVIAVGGAPGPGPTVQGGRARPPIARLGLVLAFYGATQLTAAIAWVGPSLQQAAGAPPLPSLQLQIAYQGLTLAAAAGLLCAGAAMWAGQTWGRRVAVWAWAATLAQGLSLAVAGWVSLVPRQPAAPALAPGLFTLVLALGGLGTLAWAGRARLDPPMA